MLPSDGKLFTGITYYFTNWAIQLSFAEMSVRLADLPERLDMILKDYLVLNDVKELIETVEAADIEDVSTATDFVQWVRSNPPPNAIIIVHLID